jgi:hypothetical protein
LYSIDQRPIAQCGGSFLFARDGFSRHATKTPGCRFALRAFAVARYSGRSCAAQRQLLCDTEAIP